MKLIGNPVRVSGHTILPSLIPPHPVVIDLGANFGKFSYEMNEQFGALVHAVEPTPRLAEQLRRQKGVVVHEAAISTRSTLRFKIDDRNSESSRIADDDEVDAISVASLSLDDLIRGVGHVDLIKCDIEGSEIDVFMAIAPERLRNVTQISIEFHDFKEGSRISRAMVTRVIDRMKRLGFCPLVMSFWTRGDVLFINVSLCPVGVVDRLWLSLRGRWIPGISRLFRRCCRTSLQQTMA